MSYYLEDVESLNNENPGSIFQRINDIGSILYDIIQRYSKNIQLEAAKILGNVSRLSILNVKLNTNKHIKVLLSCLEQTESVELLAAIVGILVNILVDWQIRATFKDLGGLNVLSNIFLQAVKIHDWNLAGLCCQALWNFLINCTNICEEIGTEELQLVANTIAENLGMCLVHFFLNKCK